MEKTEEKISMSQRVCLKFRWLIGYVTEFAYIENELHAFCKIFMNPENLFVEPVASFLTPRAPAGGAQVVDFCPGLCRAQADHIHFVYVNK